MEEERIGVEGQDEPMTAYEMSRMEIYNIPLGIDVLKVEGKKGLKDFKKAFYVAIDTFIQTLRDENIRDVSREERQNIASLADFVPRIEFINPKAFVLGYLTITPPIQQQQQQQQYHHYGSRKESRRKEEEKKDGIYLNELRKYSDYVSKNPDLYIRKEDILKYARLVSNCKSLQITHRRHPGR